LAWREQGVLINSFPCHQILIANHEWFLLRTILTYYSVAFLSISLAELWEMWIPITTEQAQSTKHKAKNDTYNDAGVDQ
jgi:hypothetical protein